MIKIAVYGKGGIGKSTTVSNVAVALAEKGLKVMQIGCDPKADSTILLRHGKKVPTVLELYNEKRQELKLTDMVQIGYGGVVCVEAGAQGLVYAGSGMGSIHAGAEQALMRAAAHGIAVVRSTRVSEGRVLAANPKWDEAGFICGGNLNPQKARILLQLALTCTKDTKKIQEIFDEY